LVGKCRIKQRKKGGSNSTEKTSPNKYKIGIQKRGLHDTFPRVRVTKKKGRKRDVDRPHVH